MIGPISNSPQYMPVSISPDKSASAQSSRKVEPTECQTCKSRKYQDGSNEMVSFKAATHISPGSSAAKVMAHEQEHVANAYKKADELGGKVIQASVQLKTAICPECGRSYVAGGLTTTQIKYPNTNNPYQQNKQKSDSLSTSGMNIDLQT